MTQTAEPKVRPIHRGLAEIVEGMGSEKTGGMLRAVELGKIKIGGLGETRPTKSGGTFRLPQKYDHFIITTLHRDDKGDLVVDTQLMKQLLKGGELLREIPVRLLSDDIDDVLQSAFVWYGGKTVGARSDGVSVTWFNDPASGKRLPTPKVEDWNPAMLELKDSRGNRIFKLHSVLNCVIAAKEARWGGVYKFRTTSIITFRQLYSSLIHIHELTGGILRGMPIVLAMRPMQVSPEGKTSTVYVVHAEIRGPELIEVQRLAMQQAQWALENKQRMDLIHRQYQKLLVAPGQESEGEAAEIQAEFAPEQEREPVPMPTSLDDGRVLDPSTSQLSDEPGVGPQGAAAQPTRQEGTPAKAAAAPDDGGPASAADEQSPATTDKPTPPPSSEDDPCVGEWADFRERLLATAQDWEVAPDDAAKIITTKVLGLGKKGKESKISIETRRSWWAAAMDGSFWSRTPFRPA